MSILSEIKDRLSIFKNLYDVIRIINPVNKKVIYNDENYNVDITSTCYEFWNKNRTCENCVCIRALRENDTFIKIEYKEKRVFLTIASPVNINDCTYVVELIKDITMKAFVVQSEYKNVEKINDLISRLNYAMITDPLTGIYNRRFIDGQLYVDINENAINKLPMCVIILDIDYFKEVNDTYGHLAGDYILKEFGKLILESIRKSTDWVSRYGGEEFLIVLNNTNKEGAMVVSNKIKTLLGNKEFMYEGNKINITASFGVCCLKEGNIIKAKDFIKCADENLYKAKKTGRDKIVISEINDG
ncbi:diguanylate cyclase (GGDEF)-like protein [Clostridium pascui]|uniref:GGDEF domain-containing protein n=1 Tax=Clostridium pascui TaxID=46609 RepID=UPI001957C832|nr:GGDEF domain-containing protein [Clostridium pascui]MBM7869699.1 diguanylate cyclase (GGDEF)-like protein [Clostridium pascui]